MNDTECGPVADRCDERDPRRCQYVYPEGHKRAGQQCTLAGTGTGYCASHSRKLGITVRTTAARTAENAVEAGADALEMAQASWESELDALRRDPVAVKAFRRRWIKTINSGSDEALDKLQKLMAAMAPQKQETIEIPRTWELIQQLSDDQVKQAMRQLEAELGVDPSVDQDAQH